MNNKKPTLLLHSCCGPCSSYVLSYLKDDFDITLVYYNPNIYPRNEYYKRYNEQKRLIKEMFNDEIKIMKCNYIPFVYYFKVLRNKHDKEGGNRCHICYNLRLERTSVKAKELGYDFFGTTLTVSPYKNAQVINTLGKELETKYNIKFLYSDFKKEEGYKKSIEYSKKYNLYRQDYCGCNYSNYHNIEE